MADKSNEVVPFDFSALLPDLVQTSTMEIEGADINFPRIKTAHPSQDFVVDGRVPAFGIYTELNKDDDNKVVLFELPKGKDKPDFEKVPDAGILVYILAMRKGLSANILDGHPVAKNTQGAEFRTWAFNDPHAPRGQYVDTTYNYVVYLPEVDAAEYPHRLLMTRSNTNTARAINSALRAAQDKGLPSYTQPIRLWSEKRSREVGGQPQRWGVYKFRPVAPEKEFVLEASRMTSLVNELTPDQAEKAWADDDAENVVTSTATDEPAI